MMFGSAQADIPQPKWLHRLDKFVKAHQQELAALSWGLWQENGHSKGTLGIDLQPKPHFVYCPSEAIQKFNNNVDNKLQELLGLIDNYKPETEVLMIAIGKEQIKLIYFEPEISPSVCFTQLNSDVDGLLDLLELGMSEQVVDNS
ncbi:hypothetical protein IQ247_06785 [Plectonema cf. radiosum LEGE 06105]|uniref:Chaperone protein CcmS domain-containing protein n=1 Tax=Plectonema cf. radiosum LEGE 06105 TaxID=945769 RepID=A0A8J7F264_9CYAN|nr:hypothetical protein [Plectonema radiosum]MBE9212418.1 hypothetical protein [Plectonema cf. radiosum LEGE 06105]